MAIQGNNDIFNYANHAIIAIAQQPKAADTFLDTNLVQAIQQDVFGATIWLILPSLFSAPPIEATLPAIITACALFGTLLFELFRRGLNLPWPVCIILSLFTLTNGAFLFLAFNFFLSQILYSAIFISLLTSALNLYWNSALHGNKVITRAIPHYFLIWMAYPYLLPTTILLHIPFLALLVYFNHETLERSMKRRLFGVFALLPIAVVTSLFILAPSRFISSFNLSLSATGVRPSNQLISLPVILGRPSVQGVFAGELLSNHLILTAALTLGFAMLWTLLVRSKPKVCRVVPVIAVLSIYLLGILGYLLVSLWFGTSYQQWKFATYYPLILNAALPATAIILLWKVRLNSLNVTFLIIVFAIVLANFSKANQRVWNGLSADYRSLSAVNSLNHVKTVFIDKLPFGEVMLVRQYITNKLLRPSSPSYYHYQPILRNEISTSSPILSRADCFASVPGTLALPGGFYLSPDAPYLEFGEIYNFGARDCTLQVKLEGLSGVEGSGRWTDGDRIKISIPLKSKPSFPLYLTLRGHPFLVNHSLTEQNVQLIVNGVPLSVKRFTEPVDFKWTVQLNTVQDQLINIELLLPDSRIVAEVAPPSEDKRRLGLFLRELVIHE